MKLKRSLCITGITIMVGSISAFAWVIPGVDEPFDPPDYYNPWTISYPDSAPSVFTMRDLAAQGYLVQDVPLNAKSIITDVKTFLDKLNEITKLENDAKNLTSLSGTDLSGHMSDVTNDLNNIQNVEKSYQGLMANTDDMNNKWNTMFRSMIVSGTEPPARVSPTVRMEQDKALLELLEKSYKDEFNAGKSLGDQQAEINMLEKALKRLESANGNLDNTQIRAQIESVRHVIAVKRNVLLAAIASADAIHEKARIDQQIKDHDDTDKGLDFGVNDPYHPTAREQQQFTRPEGQGFVDFK